MPYRRVVVSNTLIACARASLTSHSPGFHPYLRAAGFVRAMGMPRILEKKFLVAISRFAWVTAYSEEASHFTGYGPFDIVTTLFSLGAKPRPHTRRAAFSIGGWRSFWQSRACRELSRGGPPSRVRRSSTSALPQTTRAWHARKSVGAERVQSRSNNQAPLVARCPR